MESSEWRERVFTDGVQRDVIVKCREMVTKRRLAETFVQPCVDWTLDHTTILHVHVGGMRMIATCTHAQCHD